MKLKIEYQSSYSRGELLLRTFFGWLYIAIPHMIVMIFVMIWAKILAFLAFWVVWALGSLAWAVDKPAAVEYLIFLVMMVSLSIGTVLAVNSATTMRILLLILLLTFLLEIRYESI